MKYLIYFSFLLSLISCSPKKKESLEKEVIYAPKYAKTFKLLIDGEGKKSVRIYGFKQTEISDSLDIDLGKSEIKTVIPFSSTFITYIEALGELERIIAFPNTTYVSSEAFLERVQQGKIMDIGMENPINYELLLELNPDLLMSFNLDQINNSTAQSLGLLELPIEDWKEQNPLGRTEYIVLYGFLFNKMEKALEIFKEKEASYNALKNNYTSNGRKTCISGSIFQGIWYSPAGDSYMANLYKDAGFDYAYAETEGNGSLFLDPEDVLLHAKDADFWLSPDLFESKSVLGNNQPLSKNFKAFQTGKIYGYAKKKASNDALIFFNEVPMNPDYLLKDLIKIRNPERFPTYEMTYLDQLD